MTTPGPTPSDYRVTVEAGPHEFTWIVSGSKGAAAQGGAPNRESASRLGEFAAAALSSLERVGQRNF